MQEVPVAPAAPRGLLTRIFEHAQNLVPAPAHLPAPAPMPQAQWNFVQRPMPQHPRFFVNYVEQMPRFGHGAALNYGGGGEELPPILPAAQNAVAMLHQGHQAGQVGNIGQAAAQVNAWSYPQGLGW